MSTVHIVNSKEWLTAIQERLDALTKASNEWEDKEAKRRDEVNAHMKAEFDNWQARRAAFDAKLAQWQALSWWQRRGKPDPRYTDPDAFAAPPWCFGMPMSIPNPFYASIAALRPLVVPASLNLPLFVEVEVAECFLKQDGKV